MAKRTNKASKTTRSSRARTSPAPADAIALLKADHRQVEEWFEEFESARADTKKKTLATNICQALKVHTTIEEEIFYPAFLEATGEEDIHHEAEVEHNGAKSLIAEIEAIGPDDEYYDAKVTVLAEMIKHHVNEEEQRDGMFAKARRSDMDLEALGESLAARKAELMGNATSDDEPASRRGARSQSTEKGLVARIAKRFRSE